MARARNIKPGFFKNEQLVELDFGTRLLFIGLWTLADREGRLEDRPKRIKMELFPGDDMNVDRGLKALADADFILRYEVEGARYIQVLAFAKHQNPHHREPPSTIPKPGAGPRLEGDATGKKPGASAASSKDESPGPALGQPRTSPEPALLIPDSLIPDSGSPIPEAALSPPSSEAPTRRGAVAALLRAALVEVTPGNPLLTAWVEAGATDEQLREAVTRAQDRKPPPERIPAAYLDPILREVMKPPPSRVAPLRKVVPEQDFSTTNYRKGVSEDGRF